MLFITEMRELFFELQIPEFHRQYGQRILDGVVQKNLEMFPFSYLHLPFFPEWRLAWQFTKQLWLAQMDESLT